MRGSTRWSGHGDANFVDRTRAACSSPADPASAHRGDRTRELVRGKLSTAQLHRCLEADWKLNVGVQSSGRRQHSVASATPEVPLANTSPQARGLAFGLMEVSPCPQSCLHPPPLPALSLANRASRAQVAATTCDGPERLRPEPPTRNESRHFGTPSRPRGDADPPR